MVILDADLEYDPQDIPRLLEPVLDGRADGGLRQPHVRQPQRLLVLVRHGQQGRHHGRQRDLQLVHLATSRPASSSCRWRCSASLNIQSAGFGMEAEITGKLLRRRIRPYEVPISYRARTPRRGQEDHLEGRRRGALDPRPGAVAAARPRALRWPAGWRQPGAARWAVMAARRPAGSRPWAASWSAGVPYRCRSARPTPSASSRCGPSASASADHAGARCRPGTARHHDTGAPAPARRVPPVPQPFGVQRPRRVGVGDRHVQALPSRPAPGRASARPRRRRRVRARAAPTRSPSRPVAVARCACADSRM